MQSNWSLPAALTAAGLSAAFCTIPLALVSLGIGGAWISSLTALAPYRWIFVILAVAALGSAGYNEWHLSRRPDCNCETVFSPTMRRVLLGVGVLAVVLLLVSPWLIAPSPRAATQQAQAVVTGSKTGQHAAGPASDTPASYQQVVLEVNGMTCKACPTTVRKALKQVEGVYSVEATFRPPEAVVRFDPAKTSVSALTEATKGAGFPSRPKPSS